MNPSDPLSYVIAAYLVVFIPLIILRLTTAQANRRLRRELELLHEE